MKIIRPHIIAEPGYPVGTDGFINPDAPVYSHLLSSSFSATGEDGATAYSNSTVYYVGQRVEVLEASLGWYKIYRALQGSTSTVTMTIASPCVVTWTAHGLAANTPISFATDGALPTGLTAGTVYYVLAPAANSFNVSATPGGAAINTSGTQSGTHTATAGNYNNSPPASPTYWLDVGYSQRARMFDQSVQSQSYDSVPVEVTVELASWADSVVLLNLAASSVQVVMTDSIEGVVYDQTYSLIDPLDITDWYAYFFTPISRKADLAVTDLPPYAQAEIAITITEGAAGMLTYCGACLLGRSEDFGQTLLGVTGGIQDFSVKTVDDFGNYTITERAYRKRVTADVLVENTDIDRLQHFLAVNRATPLVFLPSEDYTSLIVYGFYKDFSNVIAYPTVSECSIEIEGLT